MAKKTNSVEHQQRISEVYELLLAQASRMKIIQYASKKWGIVERSADELIAKAKKILLEEQQEDRGDLFEKHLQMKRDLYMRAFTDKNWALCNSIERDIAEFCALYPSKKIDIPLGDAQKPLAFISIQSVPQASQQPKK